MLQQEKVKEQTTTPKDSKKVRVPEQAIVGFISQLEQYNVNMHGFAMMAHGTMIAEEYWSPFHKDSLHRMYSVAKSFTSLAIGLLIEEGKLKLSDHICDYFQDKLPKEGAHPWILKMTIRDMLCMTTCHHATTFKRYDKDDWVESFFHVEPTHEPGTIFSYDTSSAHVLCALAERLSGMEMLDYLRSKALDSIGFSKEAYMIKDPMGVSQGGSGLVCKLRDLLGVAKLCLLDGVYQGKQLLPKAYLQEATSNQVDTMQQPFYDEQFGYGYQIWQMRKEGFCFYGMGGQLALCFPKHEFILATMADTQGDPDGLKNIYDAFYTNVYPYLEAEESKPVAKDIKTQPLHVKCLSEVGAFHKHCLDASAVDVSKLNGSIYHMEKNSAGFERIWFELTPTQGAIHYTKDKKDGTIRFGFQSGYEQQFPNTSMQCTSSGVWLRENVLFVKTNIIDEVCAFVSFAICWKEDSITVSMKRIAEPFLASYDGFMTGYRRSK